MSTPVLAILSIIFFIGLLLGVLDPPDISSFTIVGATLVLTSAVAIAKILFRPGIEWNTPN